MMVIRKMVFLVCVLFVISCDDSWHKYDLASVNLGNSIQGSFFLGIGSINQTEYMFGWYFKNDGWVRLQIETYHVKVVMNEDNHPYVLLDDWGSAILHVPHGTIMQRYSLN